MWKSRRVRLASALAAGLAVTAGAVLDADRGAPQPITYRDTVLPATPPPSTTASTADPVRRPSTGGSATSSTGRGRS